MMHFLPYLTPLMIPFLSLYGIHLGGIMVLTGFGICFFFHPLLDVLFGRGEVQEVTLDSFIWSSLLLIYLPIQIFFLISILLLVSKNVFSVFELIGVALSTGAVSGALGITIAHELIHRKKRWERAIGVGLLVMVNYAHFRVEHVFGHHKNVATPKDPASARKGEFLYSFLFRSIKDSWLSAWKLEARKKSLVKNRLIHYHAIQIFLFTAIVTFFGWSSLLVFIAQSLVAIITLEAINFIEHYGLERSEIRPGVYGPVSEHHSWDSDHRMTNWFLFNLGRHSHHHTDPMVHYQNLKNAKTNNKLRYGYSLEIWRAFLGIRPEGPRE